MKPRGQGVQLIPLINSHQHYQSGRIPIRCTHPQPVGQFHHFKLPALHFQMLRSLLGPPSGLAILTHFSQHTKHPVRDMTLGGQKESKPCSRPQLHA